MNIKQYKICPTCKNWNDARAFECFSCGSDLTNIKPVTKQSIAAQKNQGQIPSAKKGKVCTECGFVNTPQARKCEKCGEDLSDVLAVSVQNQETSKNQIGSILKYEFLSVDGNYHYDIPDEMDRMILGRESFLSEYLTDKMYVSRQHAAIALNSNNFSIRNLSQTNPTFVENQELEPGKEYTFPYGKEIGLGGKVINGSRQKDAAYLVLRVKE